MKKKEFNLFEEITAIKNELAEIKKQTEDNAAEIKKIVDGLKSNREKEEKRTK